MLVMKVGQGDHEQKVCSTKGSRDLVRDWQPGEKFKMGNGNHASHTFCHVANLAQVSC